jgi:two-component system, LytTR family, sensor kinase
MRPEWHRYWKETYRHLIYIPAGILISFIPFVFFIKEYHQQGILLDRFLGLLTFGLTISSVISLFFLAAYAVFTLIFIKTKLQFWTSFYLQIATTILAIVLGIWSALSLRAWMTGERMQWSAFFANLVFGGFMTVLFLLYAAYQRARRDMLALKVVVAEARYNTLEHQMRPHFLFNALNSLAELIESGHENSAKMTQTLADLYRQILTNSGMKTAPLKSEIDIARRYLEIEKIRFGKRLKFSFKLLANDKEIFLPSLVVQTLVENAVKHGIAKSVEGGEILVELTQPEKQLYHLRISNTGKPFVDEDSSGTGLVNTRARLELLYGKLHQFNIAASENAGTVASFYFSGEKID